jgi:hypothetical protein
LYGREPVEIFKIRNLQGLPIHPIVHKIGSLVPSNSEEPKFMQAFFYDSETDHSVTHLGLKDDELDYVVSNASAAQLTIYIIKRVQSRTIYACLTARFHQPTPRQPDFVVPSMGLLKERDRLKNKATDLQVLYLYSTDRYIIVHQQVHSLEQVF